MTDTFSIKPDWADAKKRWISFWERDATDRPCMCVKARRPTDIQPPPLYQTLQDKYFDPEYVVGSYIHGLESTYHGGESVPAGGFFMAGYALGCGEGAGFAPDTIWHPVTMPSIRAPLGWQAGPSDPWVGKLECILNQLLDQAPGRYLVGYAMQVVVNDLLSALRGPMDFMMDLAEDLDLCVQRMEELLGLWLETFEYLKAVVDTRQDEGTVWGWPGLWHPGSLMVSQSDMSCMVSDRMFEEYVMRELDLLADRYGLLWYHVDGPMAQRHVPRLLRAPYMRCLQYVSGAGQPPNGPAYLELYRQIQAAGRCVDIDLSPENVEFVVRHLKPEGLVIRTWAGSPEEADELIAKTVHWAGSHAGREG